MDCRFYEKKFPEVEEMVMVQVKKVTETSAYVTLSEYNGIEGMILLAEVSTRRIRSILKEIRQGQFCVCLVLTVDEEKGYIDLSRKRVNADDRAKFLERYNDGKTVHSIVRQLAAHTERPVEDMCKLISWPLYKNKKYKHAYDAFRHFIASNDDSVFRSGGLELPEALIAPLCATIRRRMTPTPVKMNAKVKVQCYEYEGILAVKAALLAGLAHNDENKEENPHATTLDVTVIAPPHYGLVTTSMGKEPGLKKMEAALASIEKEILRRKGTYALELAPVVVSGVDDEKMHADQLEVKKDEDSDSDSGSDSDVEGMGI